MNSHKVSYVLQIITDRNDNKHESHYVTMCLTLKYLREKWGRRWEQKKWSITINL